MMHLKPLVSFFFYCIFTILIIDVNRQCVQQVERIGMVGWWIGWICKHDERVAFTAPGMFFFFFLNIEC